MADRDLHTEEDENHHWKPVAVRLQADGLTRVGYEYQATSPGRYPFRCTCDELRYFTLERAAELGVIELVDIPEGQ